MKSPPIRFLRTTRADLTESRQIIYMLDFSQLNKTTFHSIIEDIRKECNNEFEAVGDDLKGECTNLTTYLKEKKKWLLIIIDELQYLYTWPDPADANAGRAVRDPER